KQMSSLSNFIYNYKKEVLTYSKEISSDSSLSFNIIFPKGYQPNLTFIGLFKSPIPNHTPIIGIALLKKTKYQFNNIPPGKYYLLVCSLKKSINPFKYFFLDDCLRGMVDKPLIFPVDSNKCIEIVLRTKIESDPPILVNIPKLLFDTYKDN
ncbi:MAG: AraC family transcriptional regulator, partial [Bacilli bacterium]